MASSSSNNAAMSLWSKFSDLQQQAEQCRQQRGAARHTMDRVRAEMEQLQQTVASEKRVTAAAIQKAETLHAQLQATSPNGDTSGSSRRGAPSLSGGGGSRLVIAEEEPSLTLQLDQAEQVYSTAVMAHETAKRKLEQWKAWKVDQLLMLQQPDFRHQCYQWRLQAAAAGLSHAVTVAALKALEASPENMEGLEEETAADAMDDYDENSDPTTWSIPDDDFELREAVEEYQKIQTQRATAVAELDSWKAKQTALQTKCRGRLERREQLQTQLQSLAKECGDLQSETAQLKSLTEDDLVLAATYRTSEYYKESFVADLSFCFCFVCCVLTFSFVIIPI